MIPVYYSGTLVNGNKDLGSEKGSGLDSVPVMTRYVGRFSQCGAFFSFMRVF